MPACLCLPACLFPSHHILSIHLTAHIGSYLVVTITPIPAAGALALALLAPLLLQPIAMERPADLLRDLTDRAVAAIVIIIVVATTRTVRATGAAAGSIRRGVVIIVAG